MSEKSHEIYAQNLEILILGPFGGPFDNKAQINIFP